MKKTTLDELLAMANAKAVRRQPSDEEHRIQVSCVRWFRLKYPHLFARLFAVPNSDDTAVKALCSLLICRRVWWERLNWLPNWSATDQLKYYISRINDNVVTGESLDREKILSFPDAEVRDDFLKSFHELIVEAKYLL